MDLKEINPVLDRISPQEIILWAHKTFGKKLVMSSSFGAESALMLHLVTTKIPKIPVIFIDTGYLFPETYKFVAHLTSLLHLNLKIRASTTSPHDMEERKGKLWEQGEEGLEIYHWIRKKWPLTNTIKQLGAKAIMHGVRRDQSTHRASFEHIRCDEEGIYHIYPVLSLKKAEVKEYFKKNKLPYHPLVAEGYESIGDTHTTVKGRGREGRLLGEKKECGLHLDKVENYQI